MKVYVLIYILYIFIVHRIAYHFNNTIIQKKDVKAFLFILIVLGSLISAFRPENTQDTAIYNLVYQDSLYYVENTRITSFRTLFANRQYYSIEFFYLIIMACFRKLFIKPIVFYFVQGVVSNSVMVQGLYLLCEYVLELRNEEKNAFFCTKIMLIYSLYQLFCGVLYTSSAIRDGLSISLGVFAIANLLLNKRKLISVILLLMSILIHTTSIVFVCIYFIALGCKIKRIQKFYLKVLCILIPLLYFLKIGKVLVGFITPLIGNFLSLLRINAFYSYIYLLDFRLPKREGMIVVITCLILGLLSRFIKLYNNSIKCIAIIILGLLMYTIAYPIPALARLLYINILFMIPLVIGQKKMKKSLYMIWTLYFIPQYVYVFGYFL